jgi:hypothetical protein
MLRYCSVVVMVAVVAVVADAGPLRQWLNRSSGRGCAPVPAAMPAGPSEMAVPPGIPAPMPQASPPGAPMSEAQQKAGLMASFGRLSHGIGAPCPPGQYEGIGYSTASAQDAIRSCCYWGRRTPISIGVAQGRNGWYACVRYQ